MTVCVSLNACVCVCLYQGPTLNISRVIRVNGFHSDTGMGGILFMHFPIWVKFIVQPHINISLVYILMENHQFLAFPNMKFFIAMIDRFFVYFLAFWWKLSRSLCGFMKANWTSLKLFWGRTELGKHRRQFTWLILWVSFFFCRWFHVNLLRKVRASFSGDRNTQKDDFHFILLSNNWNIQRKIK